MSASTHLWTATPTYSPAHRRVTALHGAPAKAFQCVGIELLGIACDSPASHWSYDHSAPLRDELHYRRPGADGIGAPYSGNPRYYSPRCASCNRRLDIAVATGTVQPVRVHLDMPELPRQQRPSVTEVLHWLTQAADPDGLVIATAERIALDTGLSTGTVETALRDLTRAGQISRRRGTNGTPSLIALGDIEIPVSWPAVRLWGDLAKHAGPDGVTVRAGSASAAAIGVDKRNLSPLRRELAGAGLLQQVNRGRDAGRFTSPRWRVAGTSTLERLHQHYRRTA